MANMNNSSKEKEKPRDLTEMQKELAAKEQVLYFSCKIQVERKQEFLNDPEIFRLYWKRRFTDALKNEGNVRFLVLL